MAQLTEMWSPQQVLGNWGRVGSCRPSIHGELVLGRERPGQASMSPDSERLWPPSGVKQAPGEGQCLAGQEEGEGGVMLGFFTMSHALVS